ncbi:MAG: hypothetical protein IJK23_11515 [Clostridia bacterium]|nr:hypothetical protein [Clostridia bacterium]
MPIDPAYFVFQTKTPYFICIRPGISGVGGAPGRKNKTGRGGADAAPRGGGETGDAFLLQNQPGCVILYFDQVRCGRSMQSRERAIR